MSIKQVNQVIEEFTKLFYETESLALKQGIKCLTTTELHVIEAIGKDTLSMNALSDRLGITMGTTTVAINKLFEKGFIKRKRTDADRRKVFVTLSKKGEDALNFHNNFHNMIITSITKNIEPDQLDIFTHVFSDILSNLKNQVEFFKPDLITTFNKGDLVSVLDIKGTPIIRNHFASLNITIYTLLTIVDNQDNKITLVDGEGKQIEINSIDAKNLIVVKQELV